MIKFIGAVACAAAFVFAQANGAAAQLDGANPQLAQSKGLSLAEIRSAIVSSGAIAIDKEVVVDGSTIFFLNVEGLHIAMIATCPAKTAPICTGASFLTPYPKSLAATAEFVNQVNGRSKYGWLSVDASGRPAAHSGLVLLGVSKDALVLNIQVYAAFFALKGKQLYESGSTGGAGKADISASREIIDESHLPAKQIGLTADISARFIENGLAENLLDVIGDAQRYGELRKIANDYLED